MSIAYDIDAIPVPTGTWVVDPAHSTVEFQVRHMGIATVKGQFTEFAGVLEIDGDYASATARGSIRVASLDTHEPRRDAHLRSADFFDVERFEQITFESTSVRPIDEETFHIAGNLTLHGVTREIVLEAIVLGRDTDPWGNERIGFEVIGQLNRRDFDMRFSQALGSGNALVSDRVRLALDISAIRQG
jgi:polyisoprenoid-binding protein YceI